MQTCIYAHINCTSCSTVPFYRPRHSSHQLPAALASRVMQLVSLASLPTGLTCESKTFKLARARRSRPITTTHYREQSSGLLSGSSEAAPLYIRNRLYIPLYIRYRLARSVPWPSLKEYSWHVHISCALSKRNSPQTFSLYSRMRTLSVNVLLGVMTRGTWWRGKDRPRRLTSKRTANT